MADQDETASRVQDSPEVLGDTTFSGDLAGLILEGKLQQKFEIMGRTVRLNTLDTGIEELLATQCSGLDAFAREQRWRVLAVAQSLKSVGGYDFPPGKEGMEEKLAFLRTLQPPVFDLFSEKFLELRLKAEEDIRAKIENIKKLQPDQSAESSGD